MQVGDVDMRSVGAVLWAINKKTAVLAFLAHELAAHKISERGAYWYWPVYKL
jgi:hypothetical protein